ncbi:MAG TPA: NADPH-dependent 7-cyano-7-deazaguanine reductase QueF [Arenimonas sp.]|nr:NADPH-dependent 7-cyano-7-deazaguanine reductase QueF [Arenimonas sp.]HOZ03981.1 NADPH-dependent 7-cyano-7-deazaguanine reductase QueF [Arenimonas sp.]HPO23239.1 NADPH-dependent 7-cyano-7-deazaguanine reductase QueF [Arenimonas sp.]HPW31379.1 NADPH-dependent 7-cyano-7-deazaguanine reductase QueF [Arenimonas sp.]
MNSIENSSLGKAVSYGGQYDASVLYPIPRAEKRHEIGIGEVLPFSGVDIWNAYEFSWLDARGKPKVALIEFRIPVTSPNIIESKSFKLYLNSYMQTRFADSEILRQQIARDLSQAAGANVSVMLVTVNAVASAEIEVLEGTLIDDLPIDIENYGPPNANYLSADPGIVTDEVLVSHLLKSNCPVTGQPDWASVQIAYRGPRLDRDGLLRYLISYREHNEFHEQCVERIFVDILRECSPQRLSVYARYTRRGGLDINPFRASPGLPNPGNPRTARQ